MRTVINVVLGLIVVGLLYIVTCSILDPIKFNEEKATRENAVKEALTNIRNAEEEYKLQHEGQFTDSMSVLIDFVKNGRKANVVKEGELSDEQMDNGLTESKAAAIVRRGNASEIAANGLQGFRRDTVYTSLAEALFGKDFNVDDLQYIPYSDGQKFELETTVRLNKSGTLENMMECRAPIDAYMKGMNEREVYNLKDAAEKADRYAGLKFGDLINPNNNAGNWE